jgi:hypothetical protein
VAVEFWCVSLAKADRASAKVCVGSCNCTDHENVPAPVSLGQRLTSPGICPMEYLWDDCQQGRTSVCRPTSVLCVPNYDPVQRTSIVSLDVAICKM